MTRLVIFAKAPEPGKAKTRLIPALGASGAALLALHMLERTLGQALQAGLPDVELCMSPSPGHSAWQGMALPPQVITTAQVGGDLGQRMASAVDRITSGAAAQPVLLIGTDCPALDAAVIAGAANQLLRHDAVMIPASDGGYVLLGLKAPCPAIFTDIAWSTSVVAAQTLSRLAQLGLSVWLGAALHDIDEPPDLAHLPANMQAALWRAAGADRQAGSTS